MQMGVSSGGVPCTLYIYIYTLYIYIYIYIYTGARCLAKVYYEVMGTGAGGMNLTISLHGEDVHEHGNYLPRG